MLANVMFGKIYLIHFDEPVNKKRPARHYLGWTVNLTKRFQLHITGRGAFITKAAAERNIKMEVARVWEGTIADERYIKDKLKAGTRLCPICMAERGKKPLSLANMNLKEVEVIQWQAA